MLISRGIQNCRLRWITENRKLGVESCVRNGIRPHQSGLIVGTEFKSSPGEVLQIHSTHAQPPSKKPR